MNIYDAITKLENEQNILIDKVGHKYQRYNKENIYREYSKAGEEYKNGSVGGTIKNIDFLKKNIENEFEQELQFYQKPMNFPMLCRVKEGGWNNYKVVCLNSFSGTMFNTQFGESYIPSHRTKIIPLTNDEIDKFKYN